MPTKILLTGGAGYVGCPLTARLLGEGYGVTVFDNLLYGGRGLLPFFSHPNFQFVKGDIRDKEQLREAVRDVDVIIHLAAIVGYPACKKDPRMAEEVNIGGTRNLLAVRAPSQAILYASTGSNYGTYAGALCTEETPLNPISLYGISKTKAESEILDAGNAVAYRFATAFGVAARLRLDLLINDFVYRALKERSLILYEKHFKRTFIHVTDMARSFSFAIANLQKMKDDVFNVGSEKMNFSKEEIAVKIRERIPYYLHFAEVNQDEDKRNYEVSYEKIRRLGLTTSVDVDQGIDELIRAYSVIDLRSEFSNV
ncbi:MAG: NAD-dependent epimerase/dehydratase family protein [Dehalococcoidia bacterium]